MKDISATLRRIDEEITGWRQQIARARNEIGRLEETRLTILGLAEADQAAHHAGGPALLPGSAAHPQLIVRRTGGEDGSASHPAKTGQTLVNGAPVKMKRRRPAGTLKAKRTKKIMAMLAERGELTSVAVGEAFGLPVGPARHPIRELLRELVEDGQLVRS